MKLNFRGPKKCWIAFIYDFNFWHIFKFFASSRYENHCQKMCKRLFGVSICRCNISTVRRLHDYDYAFPYKIFHKVQYIWWNFIVLWTGQRTKCIVYIQNLFFYQIDHLKLLWIRKGSAIGCWVGFLIRIQVCLLSK